MSESVKRWMESSYSEMLTNLPIACPLCKKNIESWLNRNILQSFSVISVAQEYMHSLDAANLEHTKQKISHDLAVKIAVELSKNGLIRQKTEKVGTGYEFMARVMVKKD